MLNEAKISRPRPRPRPGSWGRDRDRGQSFEVEAKAEAKHKVMNKKYQMLVDNIQAILYDIMIETTQFNFWFSLAQ